MIPVLGSIVKPAGKLGPILYVVIGPPELVGFKDVIADPTGYTFGEVYDKLAGACTAIDTVKGIFAEVHPNVLLPSTKLKLYVPEADAGIVTVIGLPNKP